MIERLIVTRYLRSKNGQGFARIVTWFSFIGIALGVATLIVVTSVMNGFRQELLDKIVGMKGHIIVHMANRSGISNYENIVKKIKSVCQNDVINILPQIEQQVVITANGYVGGVLVQGLSSKSLSEKKLISSHLKTGTIADFSKGTVFIGKRLAENLKISCGDTIKLLIPESIVTPFGKLPKEETLLVSGIFEVGMNEYDKNIIIIPLADAQTLFNQQLQVSQIEVFVKDVECVKNTSQKIRTTLGHDFSVLDWQHTDASIFHAVVVEKNVMTLILSIIVLVAVFNIISGLTMLTNSKMRDIAILRTIGATKKMILKIFLYIGASIGILGTTTGVALGLAVSINIDNIKQMLEKLSHSEFFNEEIYFLSQIPSKTDWREVLCITSFSFILCIFAAIYPARKAARLDPVEILRL
jgi:lipoprotein-releasing system permease protein